MWRSFAGYPPGCAHMPAAALRNDEGMKDRRERAPPEGL
jgi:hypothetical protein